MRTYRFTAFPDSENQRNNLQQILDEASSLPEYSFAHRKLFRGVYRGQFFFDGNKNYPGVSGVSVVVEGCGIGKTVISGALAASEILSDGLKRGTFRTYTAFFSGPRVELKKLTIENTSGLPPPEGIGEKAMQGIALYAAAERMICKKIELSGHQDTLFLAPLPAAEREKGGFRGPGEFAPRKPTLQLYEKCVISGTVDFVFGGAASLFRKCKFVVRNAVRSIPDAQAAEPVAQGTSAVPAEQAANFEPTEQNESKKYYVAAPCADSPAAENDSSSGFFFKDCTFSVECTKKFSANFANASEAARTAPATNTDFRISPATGAAAHSVREPQVFLARPWRPYGRCFLFNCRIDSGFSPELWHIWNSEDDKKTAGFYLSGNCDEKDAPKTGKNASKADANTDTSVSKEWGQPLSDDAKRELLSKIEAMANSLM